MCTVVWTRRAAITRTNTLYFSPHARVIRQFRFQWTNCCIQTGCPFAWELCNTCAVGSNTAIGINNRRHKHAHTDTHTHTHRHTHTRAARL